MTEKELKGRVVSDVLKNIIPLIPKSETKLLDELNKFNLDLNYKAVEVQMGSDCWIPFINILNYFIPNIHEEWHIKIRDILNNK
jgi:hypothetical protein